MCTNVADGLAIDTSELTRRFGNLAAVDHIALRVPYGEISGLLGANGALTDYENLRLSAKL